MVRVMIMKVLSVSGVLATSGSSSSSAFLIPAASSNNMISPTSTSTSSRLRPQIISCYAREPTRIYYRDDDNASIDAMLGVERDQLPLPTTINPDDDYQTASSSDFRSRMRRILVQQQKNASSSRRSNTLSVTSLEEYASVIEEGRREGRLVVVRFHATWCKKCQTLRPSFDKLAISHPHITFVDVPILETNTNLHQGLGVKSVPYGHIYHPTNGLVVETKLSRQSLGEFVDLMTMHSTT
ncbi:hypothetical protein ACHAWU_009721 [Discostella pseudostelligera]|uniref:Thioredoxin domain-containing protein n=1 Tax=Discostella pseudostelligera TaxID=259834 RepID=A0ABD3MPB6_9STRA